MVLLLDVQANRMEHESLREMLAFLLTSAHLGWLSDSESFKACWTEFFPDDDIGKGFQDVEHALILKQSEAFRRRQDVNLGRRCQIQT